MADNRDAMKKLGIDLTTPLMLQEQLIPKEIPVAPIQAPIDPGVEQQTAEGLLSQYAQPRSADYQAPQIQVPQEDTKSLEAQNAILEKLKGLDTDYKSNLADAEDRKFKSELFATLGNYLPGAIAGATAMNTKASVRPADMPKIVAADPTAKVGAKYKTDYENLLKQYKTVKDDSGLSAKDKLYASIAQAQLDQGAARLNNNIVTTDKNAGIRVGNAVLSDQAKNELSDKQIEAQTDLDNTLSEIGKVTQEANKFKDYLGPNKAAYEKLKEGKFGAIVPGDINKDYVKFRADVKALQGQYQKVISGLTVSDKEREELRSYIPNEEMPYESFQASAKAFEERVRKLREKTKGNQAKYQGKNTEGYRGPSNQSSAAPHGDTVERNGKTYKWNASAGKYQPVN